MAQNIRQVYEAREGLISKFQESVNKEGFEGCEMGCPVIVDDALARIWLEMNYLFSTGFRPGRLPGIGEIGADIEMLMTKSNSEGKKYLTVPVEIMERAVRSFSDFRGIEDICLKWKNDAEKNSGLFVKLNEKLKGLTISDERLEREAKCFNGLVRSIEEYGTGFPYPGLIKDIERLRDILKELNEHEAETCASKLIRTMKKYSPKKVIETVAKISKYHKGLPGIDEDLFIRTSAPAASGGLCLHTHPGYDDISKVLPSSSDLFLIACQNGLLPMSHFGGGETTGEHYVMHVPKKIFFEEVQKQVDERGVEDEAEIIKIKQAVLDERLGDIMADEILGFKISVDPKNKKVAVINPIITAREYEKHRPYLEQMGSQPFAVEGLLMSSGDHYFRYIQQEKDFVTKFIADKCSGK